MRRLFSIQTLPRLAVFLAVLAGLTVAATAPARAMQRKPDFILRVHQETDGEGGGSAFSMPARRASGDQRPTFISRIPLLTERDIEAVYPFKTPDGGNGAALQLRPHGRLALSVGSAEAQGRCFLIYANGRQLPDVLVDQKVEDGIFVIPSGLTDDEIAKLTSRYPLIGQAGKKKK